MKKILIEELSNLKVINKEYISKDDITDDIKDKIFESEDGYNYIIDDHGLNDDELKILLMAKQAKDIRSIKRIAMFFFILTCLGLLLSAYNYYRIISLLQ